MIKKIKGHVMDMLMKSAWIRNTLRTTRNLLLKVRYQFRTRGIKTHDKIVIFSSFNGKGYSDTPKAIYEYMLRQKEFEDYKFIWIFKDIQKYKWLAKNPNTFLVKDKSKRYDRVHARAKYWIYNSRIYDHVTPKKDQIYVQCWHGTPLKRLGYDIEASENAMNGISEIQFKYKSDAKRFEYLLSPSAFATEKFTSAWNLEKTGQKDKIMEVGYPRNDFLINHQPKDVERIKNELNIPEDKKVLLYAPTWRDNQHAAGVGYVYSNELDFDQMQERFGSEWVVLFRAHYLVANSFDFEKYQGFVYNVSDYDDINHLYVVADALVTDYSSVFFDYANLKRPMLFYMYDLKYYKEDLRGFYIDLDELPGPIVEEQDDFFDQLEHMDEWFSFDEKYQKFNDKYNYLDDGQASKRLVEHVF